MTTEEHFVACLDTDYSYRLAKSMETFKTNPDLGFRTAGSEAERLTGDLLLREMKELGLSEVRKEEIKVDAWEFSRAELEFTDRAGTVHHFKLGAYQTSFQTEGPEEFRLVWAGKGTAEDYQGMDVTGKLVLADINQREEWWINFPVYQAHLKGAAALLAVQESGYGEIDPHALNAQDIAGPADAPAFSISQADAGLLKAALQESGGEVKVIFDACTRVEKNQKSYNIVGTIPGRETDSMILLSAHYDSYFSGFQDDNCAVAMMLGIARALLQSGYQPEKTLVFAALAAEEWGISDSKYDWSTGAWQEVFKVHPEWAGKVIADLNFELPAHAHSKKDRIRCTHEYTTFLKEFAAAVTVDPEAYPEGLEVVSPIETWSDDFSIAISGIPSMVNDFAAGSFMETHYHSQFDNESYYDPAVYRFHHELYGRLLLALDRLAVVPLDFTPLFRAMEGTLNPDFWIYLEQEGTALEEPGRRLHAAILSAQKKSRALYKLTDGWNRDRALALADGQTETADRIRRQALPAEKQLLFLFKKAQEYFVRLDWHDNVIFPQEGARHNLVYVKRAMDSLREGQALQALEHLYQIDNNRYAFQFEEPVFTHFTDYVFAGDPDRLTWGCGRIRRHANLFGLVQTLKEKTARGETEFTAELTALKTVTENQRRCFLEDVTYMAQAVEKMNGLMDAALASNS